MTTSLLQANRQLVEANMQLRETNDDLKQEIHALKAQLAGRNGQDCRLEAAQKDFDHINASLANVETRAYVFLTFQTLFLGLVALLGTDLWQYFNDHYDKYYRTLSKIQQQRVQTNNNILFLLIAVGIIFLLLSLGFIIASTRDQTQHPRSWREQVRRLFQLNPAHDVAQILYLDIVERSADKFKGEMLASSLSERSLPTSFIVLWEGKIASVARILTSKRPPSALSSEKTRSLRQTARTPDCIEKQLIERIHDHALIAKLKYGRLRFVGSLFVAQTVMFALFVIVLLGNVGEIDYPTPVPHNARSHVGATQTRQPVLRSPVHPTVTR